MHLVRTVAYTLLAGLFTVYSVEQTWYQIQYLPGAGQAVDPEPWKTIWWMLSIGVVLCTPAGVVGMWINLRRQSYGWMAACIALLLVFPLIIGALQSGGM